MSKLLRHDFTEEEWDQLFTVVEIWKPHLFILKDLSRHVRLKDSIVAGGACRALYQLWQGYDMVHFVDDIDIFGLTWPEVTNNLNDLLKLRGEDNLQLEILSERAIGVVWPKDLQWNEKARIPGKVKYGKFNRRIGTTVQIITPVKGESVKEWDVNSTGGRLIKEYCNKHLEPIIEDLFAGFDFSVCQAALVGKTLLYTEEFARDIPSGSIKAVGPKSDPIKTFLRMMKYKEKEFKISPLEVWVRAASIPPGQVSVDLYYELRKLYGASPKGDLKEMFKELYSQWGKELSSRDVELWNNG